jgi:beta-galactosidase
MCLQFEAVARFAVMLSVFVLAAPKRFLGDSPDKNPIPTRLPGRDALLVGTDWYPEQWPESRWETDLRMMEAAHLQVVRLAEFAWSRMVDTEIS